MRDHRLRRLVTFGFALFLGACASNPAPSGWLPSAAEGQKDPYGAWVVVKYADSAVAESLLTGEVIQARYDQQEGELIALTRDTLLLLADSALLGFSRNRIVDARTCAYEANYDGLAAWNLVGSLSTLSNGFFAGLTLPLWLIVGSMSVGAQSHAPFERYDAHYFHREDSWDQLSRYARFPQGLPASLHRATLRPKPFMTPIGRTKPIKKTKTRSGPAW